MARDLLVIDDDEPSCRLIKAIFSAEGFEVAAAHDAASGIARIATEAPSIVLLDLRLGHDDGMAVLEKIKSAHPSIPIVMLTAHGDLKSAVRATQLGAIDFLTKPIDHEEIVVVVQRALSTRALQLEVEDLRRQVGEGGSLATQMGSSPQVHQVIEQVRTVAASNFTVLILGETGTGKEGVAQAVHRESDRRQKPFVALDCGAIPEQLLESELFGHERGAFTGADKRRAGRFELAQGGTLFLDEIGNLPMGLQAKLLRVLESRQVQSVGGTRVASLDVRFVAATHNDLQECVTEGRFRADLYFRLAQYTISLPALRDRPTDIAYLSHRFLEEASIELRRPVQRILPEAMTLLEKYAWPGNVRELRNVVRQAVLTTQDAAVTQQTLRGLLGRSAFPLNNRPEPTTGTSGKSLREIAEQAAAQAERSAICGALRSASGNKTHAARALKTDYKTLHLKMKKYGLRGRDFG